jgi:hypothetical protein
LLEVSFNDVGIYNVVIGLAVLILSFMEPAGIVKVPHTSVILQLDFLFNFIIIIIDGGGFEGMVNHIS